MHSSIILPATSETIAEARRSDPIFSEINADPLYGEFGQIYYPLVFGNKRRDASFAIVIDGKISAYVACSIGESTLDWYGLPARIFLAKPIAIREAFRHIDCLINEHNITTIKLRDDCVSTISSVGNECLNRGFTAVIRLFGVADLTNGEIGLRRGLRKSYKSLLNWGRQNLTIEIIDSSNQNQNLFHRYQEFHKKISGHITRPQSTWNIMRDWIFRGRGELILGSLDGELVAGSLVVDGGTTSYYASGVYDRSKFGEASLAHWPLWLSMLHSSERGLSIFWLGNIPMKNTGSDKDINIGYFKRGFSSKIEASIEWSYSSVDA